MMGHLLDTIKRAAGLMNCPSTYRRQFEGIARDATEHTRIVTLLAFQHDLRPSVARELFAEFCKQSIANWRDCGRFLLQTASGLHWMEVQIEARGEAVGE